MSADLTLAEVIEGDDLAPAVVEAISYSMARGAELIGTSRSVLYRYADREERPSLRTYRLGGRRLVTRADLLAFVAECRAMDEAS